MPAVLKKGLWVLAAVAALAAGYFSSVWWRDPGIDDRASTVVDFSLPDLDGKERWLSEWQGKIVVLNFWATWCAPCREEMPLLMDVHKRYQDRGLRVIGIAIDTREAVAAYARELRINYPLLIGDEAGLGLMSRYGNSRGALPYTVVIGRDGAIVAKKLGAYQVSELESIIGPLVTAAPATNMAK